MDARVIVRNLWLGLLFLSVLPGLCLAHSKTDVITLVNGSTLIGEIKGLIEGRLSLGTDSMGTVRIEWKDVVHVASDFRYEVRLQDGRRYYGSLDTVETDRIRIQGDGSQDVERLEMVEIRPIESELADRFDIRLGLGVGYDKASRVSTFSLISELSYEDERGITGLKGRTSRTDQEEESVSSNRYAISRQIWTRLPRVVRWFDGSYEDNDELDLDYRYTAGLGLGRSMIDTNQQSLIGYLGLQGAIERSQQGEKTDSLEGVLGANYSLWHFDTPEVDLSTDFTLYPGITESGRWRGNAQVRLSWELIDDLFWDVTTWATFDNQSESGSDTDYGITTGIAWTY